MVMIGYLDAETLSVGDAGALTTARSIAMTGDVSWSVSFDGSANVSSAGTLATVNTDVGTFGAGVVPQFTVNGKGLITAAADGSAYAPLVAAPASASSTGTAGQIAYDASFFYVCVATDTWVRASLATW